MKCNLKNVKTSYGHPRLGLLAVAALLALQLAAFPASAKPETRKMGAAEVVTKAAKKAAPVVRVIRLNCRVAGALGHEIGRGMAMRDGHPDVGRWQGPRDPATPCKI